MNLDTMTPNPAWDSNAHSETVEAIAAWADTIEVIVWGGDWCKDCRAVLPDLAAAFEAAGVDDDSIRAIAVDEDKQGPLVEEYDVTLIPTVIIESEGREVARFVESAQRPAAEHLAEQLRQARVEP